MILTCCISHKRRFKYRLDGSTVGQ